MKKVFYVSLMVMTMFIIAACSSTSTPGGAMKQYAGYLVNGNYEKFVEGFDVGNKQTPEEIQKQKESLVALIEEKGEKEYEKKGGLKSMEVISEKISEDGNTATVEVKTTYGNGETEDGIQKMVKKDGKWLMAMSK